ncbi:MAG: CPBP family intramembrane glutamic endopeptidase [Maioricimonas sp. JB049]
MTTAFILTLFLLGSLIVWGDVIRRVRAGEPVLPAAATEPVRWHPLPLILAGAWILVTVAAKFASTDVVEPFDPQTTMRGLYFNLGQMLLMWAALLASAISTVDETPAPFRLWRLTEQVGDGVTAFFASLAPVFVVLLATLRWRTPDAQHSLLRLLSEEPSVQAWLAVSLAAIVLAPLAEEIIFRVILQSWLTRLFGPLIAIPLVAFLFAAVHGFPDSIALIPLALILGYVFHRRQSYVAVVVAHALFNGANLLMQSLQAICLSPSG